MRICCEPGCGRPFVAHGWCRLHYGRARDKGLLPPRRTRGQRFWEKVDLDGPIPEFAPHLGPCWLWTKNALRGYGLFYNGKTQVYAHRFSYEMEHGPIPARAHLDHLCRVPACVRPSHLDPVTVLENVARSPIHNGSKTHCKHGHEFTPENTGRRPDGARVCRACSAAASRRHLARKRQ